MQDIQLPTELYVDYWFYLTWLVQIFCTVKVSFIELLKKQNKFLSQKFRMIAFVTLFIIPKTSLSCLQV